MPTDAPTDSLAAALQRELAALAPLDRLRALDALPATVKALTDETVAGLRATGTTWATIAEVLDVTRQSAQNRFRHVGRTWQLEVWVDESGAWNLIDSDQMAGDPTAEDAICNILDRGEYGPGDYRLIIRDGRGAAVESAEAKVDDRDIITSN